MTVPNRVALCLHVGVLATAAYLFTSGRPPAKAQNGSSQGNTVQTEGVVTRKDEDQDISLSRLEEFQRNQENWNKQTGKDLGSVIARENSLEEDVAGTNGNIKGAAALITVMTGLAVFFQVRGVKRSGGA